jgi:uncharacterized protein YgiB involved in biofilm formation
MEERKASTYVWLALGGIAVLSQYIEHTPDAPLQRDVYSKLEDCKQDWGSTSECSPVDDGRYSSGHYYGPTYSGSGNAGVPSKGSPHSVGTTHVSRGGFGSFGSFHFSGG